MNPTAIYSKSGKGVQEASGKTSFLERGDRAVLSAIDGRATLADVAQKVGKSFDNAFQTLIGKLDKDGFIREVSPGTASKTAAPAARAPAGRPAAKPASDDAGGDLDFSSLGTPKSRPGPVQAGCPRRRRPRRRHRRRSPAPPPRRRPRRSSRRCRRRARMPKRKPTPSASASSWKPKPRCAARWRPRRAMRPPRS